jgi:hypothetical protein
MTNFSDDPERYIEEQLVLRTPAIIKAPIVWAMTFATIVIVTGAIWRAVWIAAIVSTASLFTAWRRIIEPFCLLAFLAAIVFLCWPPGFNLQIALR